MARIVSEQDIRPGEACRAVEGLRAFSIVVLKPSRRCQLPGLSDQFPDLKQVTHWSRRMSAERGDAHGRADVAFRPSVFQTASMIPGHLEPSPHAPQCHVRWDRASPLRMAATLEDGVKVNERPSILI